MSCSTSSTVTPCSRTRLLLGAGHARGGLVEQEQPGAGCQRHRDLDEPLLAVGQGARGLAPAMGEPHEGDDLLRLGREAGLLLAHRAPRGQHGQHPRRSAEVQPDHHVVRHAHGGEDARLLERADDAAPGDVGRPQAGERCAVVCDPAARRSEIAGDGVERGRLAGAVGPDQARDAPRLHRERHARQRRDAAELDREVLDAEHQARRSQPATVGTMPRGRKNTSAIKMTP
jgi:hypothetical protein